MTRITDAWEGVAHWVLHPWHSLLLRGQQVVLPHLHHHDHHDDGDDDNDDGDEDLTWKP